MCFQQNLEFIILFPILNYHYIPTFLEIRQNCKLICCTGNPPIAKSFVFSSACEMLEIPWKAFSDNPPPPPKNLGKGSLHMKVLLRNWCIFVFYLTSSTTPLSNFVEIRQHWKLDAFSVAILKISSPLFYSFSSTTPTYQILLRSDDNEKFMFSAAILKISAILKI